VLPSCAAEAFDVMKNILYNEKANKFEHAAAEAISEIVKAMPSCATAAFDAIMMSIRNSNSEEARAIAEERIHKIVQDVPSCAAEAFDVRKQVIIPTIMSSQLLYIPSLK
jgi:hypothetical protein